MKNQVANQFHRSAQQYDQHAVIQTMMANHLIKNIYPLTPISNILEIGCGTGGLTQLLLHKFPTANITAIDIAPNMIKMAKEKIISSTVCFILGDIENVTVNKSVRYDLIISNAAFQWLQKPNQTILKLSKLLKPNGQLLFSTFGPKTFHELTQLFRDIEKSLHLPNQLHHLPMKSLAEWKSCLVQGELDQIKGIESFQHFDYPNCYQFLKSIQSIGASYQKNSLPLLQTKKLLSAVMNQYDQTYKIENGVYATYHLLYLNCLKS